MEFVVATAKATSIVIVSGVFLLAINTLIGLLMHWTSTSFIGEFFNLVSMYLPFNGAVVFSSILSVALGIFAFLIAKKIFDLASWSINSV